MMTKDGSTKIKNFMTPMAGVLVLGGGHISHIVKMLYSFQNPCINQQTKYMFTVMMTKKGTTKFVTFMTPGTGVLVLRCGHISHIVTMHYSFQNLLLHSHT